MKHLTVSSDNNTIFRISHWDICKLIFGVGLLITDLELLFMLEERLITIFVNFLLEVLLTDWPELLSSWLVILFFDEILQRDID